MSKKFISLEMIQKFKSVCIGIVHRYNDVVHHDDILHGSHQCSHMILQFELGIRSVCCAYSKLIQVF